jgi:hypothetical protein
VLPDMTAGVDHETTGVTPGNMDHSNMDPPNDPDKETTGVNTNDDEDSNAESIRDDQCDGDDDEDDGDDGTGNEEAKINNNPYTWTSSVQRVHGL